MTRGPRDAFRALALQHLSPEDTEKWLGVLRPGVRLDLAEQRFDRAMFTWQCG
ncbi:hypothetical protein [Streptomyces sp. BE230]|uniref:hypothetical protein n=1 Tax=Streptomyces sp. BE230 TaxID=3002526 RepID=UPI002ED3D79A|nr:hypothetical protein [Streptomyces sp. BE230]